MAFPSTEWPIAFDAAQTRVDGMDTVYDDDFNYTDDQIRNIQQYLGLDTELIGENVTGGPGGMASPVASGSVALILAAKDPFIAGSILQVGDNYDAAFVPKMDLGYDGVLYALGGIDASEELWIPHGALPPVGSAGRIVWDPAALTLKYDDGAAWNTVGGSGAGSYLDWATDYSYTEAAVPIEETVGSGSFDGGLVGTLSLYFKTTIEPSLSAGTVSVLLYDMGLEGGPLGVPRLVSTISTGTNGLQVPPKQLLTVVAAAPGANQIWDTPRIYEITVTSAAAAGDTAIVRTSGFEVV